MLLEFGPSPSERYAGSATGQVLRQINIRDKGVGGRGTGGVVERTFDIHHNNVAGPGSYFFSFIGETSERAENSWRRHVVAAHPGLWSLVATTRRPVPTNKADAVCAGSSAQSHASRRAPRNLVRDVIRQTAGTSEQPHYFPLLLFPWRFSATRMYIRLTASPPGLRS